MYTIKESGAVLRASCEKSGAVVERVGDIELACCGIAQFERVGEFHRWIFGKGNVRRDKVAVKRLRSHTDSRPH